MSYTDGRRPGLGMRTAQGAFIGAIPALATGNPAWLGYGAAAGLLYGSAEGRNALGGASKRRRIKKKSKTRAKSKSRAKSKYRYRSKARSPTR